MLVVPAGCSSRLPLGTDRSSGGAPGLYMTSSASVVGGHMGIYDHDRRAWQQQQPFAAWGPEPPAFRPDSGAGAVTSARADHDVVPVEDALGPPSSDSFGHDDHDDAGGPPSNDKARRRLAQNREAARKSRLRKKAYIRTLESSRMKLARLEQELTHVRRRQGVFVGGSVGESAVTGLTPPAAAAVDSGVAAFEAEYARWVEEQGRHAGELRAALQSDAVPESHLRVLVDAGLAHYDALFRAKSAAARSDALLLVLSGAWRTPAERFFLWMGGFRPSDLIGTLAPQLEPLSEHQATAVRALRQTARQLEDALAQGMDLLQQTLTEALLATTTATVDDDGDGYAAQAQAQQMVAVGKLGGLVSFVDQADHLRQQTLRNMRKILAPRQAARGLLALADYCQRLRALSSLWAARPREPA